MGIIAWIVLGLIAGAIAKFLMPGRDPGGIFITIIIGIVGAVIGGFIGSIAGRRRRHRGQSLEHRARRRGLHRPPDRLPHGDRSPGSGLSRAARLDARAVRASSRPARATGAGGESCGLLLGVVAALLFLAFDGPATAEEGSWPTIRDALFEGRELKDGTGLIEIEAPKRAQDAGTVPVTVRALQPQTAERWIKTVHLIVDENPAPVAGRVPLLPRDRRRHHRHAHPRRPVHQPARRGRDLGRRALHGRAVHQGRGRLLRAGHGRQGHRHGAAGQDEAQADDDLRAGRAAAGAAPDQPSQLYRDADGPADPLLDPAGLCPLRQGPHRRHARARGRGRHRAVRGPRPSPSPSRPTRPAPMVVQVEDSEGRRFEQTWPIGPTS